ncbi:conserved hypothetical protein [Sphingomonas sp. 8AM]|nr:conserved hypothetical protein [Sphingomonas sp. 8AM]
MIRDPAFTADAEEAGPRIKALLSLSKGPGRRGDRRHCERSEAIQGRVRTPWIASLRSQ